MTSINVGLFGHIDHGKTEVARRLSEIVSTAGLDKHPEAQRRGITIDLGFTSFILNEYIVTLVDVPGHADLIRNVVAGADIIDAAILVIDAQKGPEVQTGEHILILNYFGIKNLVVALNKVDLVNKDQTEKVGSQIKKVLIGTIFENAPIVPISAKTGEGILQLKEILYKQIKPPVRQTGPFKMPIDHAFEIKGIGTVITGTILRGEIRVGDKIQIQPIGTECKIKSIQTFKESRAEAKAGDRVGMHITGISAEKIYRGCVACQPDSLIVTNRIEAEVAIDQLFKHVLRPNITIHANAGMLVVPAKFLPFYIENGVTFMKGEVKPSEKTLAILELTQPIVVEKGDRVLVSKLDLPPRTLRIAGGGRILEPIAPALVFAREIFKKGKVTQLDREPGRSVVDYLARNKEAAKLLVGQVVTTESGIKGKMVDTLGERGAILVEFERTPLKNEEVYLKQIKRW